MVERVQVVRYICWHFTLNTRQETTQTHRKWHKQTPKLTSTVLPCDFPFHAEGVEPVQTQREAHHRHHDGYGRDKVAERRRAGDVDSNEVGRIVDLSIQHAASTKVTLGGGSTTTSPSSSLELTARINPLVMNIELGQDRWGTLSLQLKWLSSCRWSFNHFSLAAWSTHYLLDTAAVSVLLAGEDEMPLLQDRDLGLHWVGDHGRWAMMDSFPSKLGLTKLTWAAAISSQPLNIGPVQI